MKLKLVIAIERRVLPPQPPPFLGSYATLIRSDIAEILDPRNRHYFLGKTSCFLLEFEGTQRHSARKDLAFSCTGAQDGTFLRVPNNLLLFLALVPTIGANSNDTHAVIAADEEATGVPKAA